MGKNPLIPRIHRDMAATGGQPERRRLDDLDAAAPLHDSLQPLKVVQGIGDARTPNP